MQPPDYINNNEFTINNEFIIFSNSVGKEDVVDFEQHAFNLLVAAENNDLNELSKSLKIAEQYPDKISPDYLGNAMLSLCSDICYDGLQLLLHSPRICDIDTRYFEEASTTLSNNYQICALRALMSSERAKDLSSQTLALALSKNAETGQCIDAVTRKILSLDNAKKILPSELGRALRFLCERWDDWSIKTMLNSPVCENIPKKDLAYVFCLSLFRYDFRGYNEVTLGLWETAKNQDSRDELFNEAREYHRGSEIHLERLVRLAIDKISLPCLEKAVTLLIEDNNAQALELILSSKRAEEVQPKCYEEALQNTCMCFQFEGMRVLICSKIATCFTAKELYRALSFLSVPKNPENNKLIPETAREITREILKLPNAQELTRQQLDAIFDQALKSVKGNCVRPESESIANELLDSRLWENKHS